MSENKRRYLLRSSPLVAGGKARLMSNKKVQPKPAKPREVSRVEAQGYTTEPHKALHLEAECLTEAEWDVHVGKRAETAAEQQQRFEAAKLEDARRLLSFEERLTAATAEARAAKHRMDISSEVRLLRQMQQQGKEVRHLEQRLFVIERKVWRADKDAA
jgi:hypothetical protein